MGYRKPPELIERLAARDAEIIRLNQEGVASLDIAARLRLTRNRVNQVLLAAKDEGIEVKGDRRGHRCARVSRELEDQILHLWNAGGKSSTQIAEQLNLRSRGVVSGRISMLRGYGLEVRRGRYGPVPREERV